MKPTKKEWWTSPREALAAVDFAHGARRAFGRPALEAVPGTVTYLAREDQHAGTVTIARYLHDPHAPTWAKPLAVEHVVSEPRGVEWKPCVVWPFEVVS